MSVQRIQVVFPDEVTPLFRFLIDVRSALIHLHRATYSVKRGPQGKIISRSKSEGVTVTSLVLVKFVQLVMRSLSLLIVSTAVVFGRMWETFLLSCEEKRQRQNVGDWEQHFHKIILTLSPIVSFFPEISTTYSSARVCCDSKT